MTDHKFTDDDVIKALAICAKLDFSLNECKECPYKGECGTKDGNMPADALALIKCQMRELDDLKRDTIPKLQNGLERANYYGLKADEEIEHLKAEIESLQAVHADMTESLRLAAEANKDMQAEIDRLTAERDNEHKCYLHICDDLKQAVNRNITAKSEAIKEFADKLKAILNPFVSYDKCRFCTVKVEDINTLVKEMTEGTK